MIKAWWYTGDGNNFGDVICPLILGSITEEPVSFSSDRGSLVSIGSVAFWNFKNEMAFWGSGAIDDKQNSSLIHKHVYHAVRGPRTRERILASGGYCPEVYGDPSMLLPLIVDKNNVKKFRLKNKISILPHWTDLGKVKSYPSVLNGDVNIFDIRSSVSETLRFILSSEVLVTSSLHGLIVGEFFDIPTVFVEFSDNLYGRLFKFFDYYNSTGRDLNYREHIFEKDINFNIVEDLLSNSRKPEIDLKKFISSFPYEIKNKNILRYLNG